MKNIAVLNLLCQHSATLSCFSECLTASTRTCCDHRCQETCVRLYKVHLGNQQSEATGWGSQLW